MNLLDLFVHIGAKDDATGVIENVSDVSMGKLVGAAKKAATAFAEIWAVKKVYDFGRAAFDAYSEFEQLAGGAEKIFDEMDQSKILNDASRAFLDLNMSASEYLESMNTVGATFAQTMGDEKAYDTARTGMKAIADFASGTGADLGLLNEKYKLITRSAGSYQSIADQFAGILPQTNQDFLDQAKAAGFLSEEYTKLTEVPVAEYQEAVTKMLEKGVADAGFAGNTMKESLTTISGSLAATKSAWQNLVLEFGKPDANIGARIGDMFLALFGENGEGGLLRNVTKEVGVIARNVISAVGKGIADGVSWLISNGPKLVLGAVRKMIGSIGDISQMLGSFDLSQVFADMDSSGIGDSIMRAFGDIGEILYEWSPDIQGALEALWSEVVTFVTTNGPILLAKVGELLSMVGRTVLERGPELVGSVAETVLSVLENISSHGPEMGERIVSLIEIARQWLIDNGPAILEAAKTAFANIGQALLDHGPTILTNIAETVGIVLGYLANCVTDMVQAGIDLVKGILDGSTEEGVAVQEWFMNLPQTILDALGDVSSLLWGAGTQIIQGFWDGLTSKWDEVTGWVSGIGTWIAENKGPKQYDLGLLVPNGQWIMQSLQTGLEKGLPSVEDTLRDITDSIQTGINTDVSLSSAQTQSDMALMGMLGAIRDNMQMSVYLDGNTLVGGIAPRMNTAMGRL